MLSLRFNATMHEVYLKCAYCAWLNSLHVYILYEKNVILEIHIYSRQQFAHCLDGFHIFKDQTDI